MINVSTNSNKLDETSKENQTMKNLDCGLETHESYEFIKQISSSFENYLENLINEINKELKALLRQSAYSSTRLNYLIAKRLTVHKNNIYNQFNSNLAQIRNQILANNNVKKLDNYIDLDHLFNVFTRLFLKFEAFLTNISKQINKKNENDSNNNKAFDDAIVMKKQTDFSSDTETMYWSRFYDKHKLEKIIAKNLGIQSQKKDSNKENVSLYNNEDEYDFQSLSDYEIDYLGLELKSKIEPSPIHNNNEDDEEIFSISLISDQEEEMETEDCIDADEDEDENYNADEEEEEEETLTSEPTNQHQNKVLNNSFIVIDDVGDDIAKFNHSNAVESNRKKMKNMIKKIQLINMNHNNRMGPVYVGMKVLALRNKKRHLWKPATIMKICNTFNENENWYKAVIRSKFKIIYDSDDENSREDGSYGGGYKYSDDLDIYAKDDDEDEDEDNDDDNKNASDDEKSDQEKDRIDTNDNESNNTDDEVLCLGEDYNYVDETRPKSKSQTLTTNNNIEKTDSTKSIKKKAITTANSNQLYELDSKCLAYINNYENILPSTNSNLNKNHSKNDFLLQVRSRVVTFYQLLIKDITGKIIMNNEYLSSGTIAEVPSLRNSNRYLIFFDNGMCSYVKPNLVFPLFDLFSLPLDRLNMDHAQFLRNYFDQYPERPMVKLSKLQNVNLYVSNEWYNCKVTDLDISLVKLDIKNCILNKENKKKRSFSLWIYRGSFRLQPLFNHVIDSIKKSSKNNQLNSYYSYLKEKYTTINKDDNRIRYNYISIFASTLFPDVSPKVFSSKRGVAYKNTAGSANSKNDHHKNSNQNSNDQCILQGQVKHLDLSEHVRNEIIIYEPHACSPACVSKFELNLELIKHVNPLLIPMLHGWHRQIHHQSKTSKTSSSNSANNNNHKKRVKYVAPCGRLLRTINEIDTYLSMTDSKLTADKFSFDIFIHTDREFEARTKSIKIDDITRGLEPVPVSCVNCVDDFEPDRFAYSNQRIPLDGVPLKINQDDMDCCDCTDNCRDKSKCACWQKTYAAAILIKDEENNENLMNIGYKGRRLNELVASGIFECNLNCKCDRRCNNRVAQSGTAVRLQLFKTSNNKGWGLRCLDDIPKGTFICTYAGHLITEEQSDIRGQVLGDEYFAELDFIDSLKRRRYELYIEKQQKSNNITSNSNKNNYYLESDSDSNDSSKRRNSNNKNKKKQLSQIQETQKQNEISNKMDVDVNQSTYHRPRQQQNQFKSNKTILDENNTEFIVLDDEDDDFISNNFENTNHKNVESKKMNAIAKMEQLVDSYNNESSIYIMDAKLCGNIGRYFNHSCSPNIFVQNVFVDTHDLRFPWIAFFACNSIKAGQELCWDYNYTINSVPGKQLFCHCGTSSCRGRLL